jgi:hypothetical protein
VAPVRQLYIGNPRLDALNETLFALGMQPLLFGPAPEVKALTFASFYSAGPLKLSEWMSL